MVVKVGLARIRLFVGSAKEVFINNWIERRTTRRVGQENIVAIIVKARGNNSRFDKQGEGKFSTNS